MRTYDDFNECIFKGRLFADVEDKTRDGSDNKFSVGRLAVNRRGTDENPEREPNSVDLLFFGKRAEFALKYLKKGTQILVRTRLDTGYYNTKEGSKVKSTSFIVESTELLGSPKKAEDAESDPAPAPTVTSDGFIDVPEGLAVELPFA